MGVSALGLARVFVRAGSGTVAGEPLPPGTEWVTLDLGAYPPGTPAEILRERLGEPEAVETVRKLVRPLPPVAVEGDGGAPDEVPPVPTEGDGAAAEDSETRTVELETWYYRVAPEQGDRPTDWLVFDMYEQVVYDSRIQRTGPGQAADLRGEDAGEAATEAADLADALLSASGNEADTEVADAPSEPVPHTPEGDTRADADLEGDRSGLLPEERSLEQAPVAEGGEPLDALAAARKRAATRPLRPGRWAELDAEFPDAPAFDDLVKSVLAEVRSPDR
jgi:hypothetical protein